MKITDLLASKSPKAADDRIACFDSPESVRDSKLHLVCKDGSILPVLVSGTAVGDLQGDYVMSRLTAYDIVERPWPERVFSELLEAAPDAMAVTNLDGKITLVNGQTEKIFGYEREKLLGHNIEMLIPARFRHRHRSHRSDYCAQPRLRPMGAVLDLFGRRNNGAEFPIEISLSLVRTNAGHFVVSAIRDTTERKRTDDNLKLAAAEKERLIGELQEALARVKLLSGLLPICAGCKKIRDEQGFWQQMEIYIRAHSEANFSHGMCPDCAEQFGWAAQEPSQTESGREQAVHAER